MADPYCYPGSTVLVNRLGIRDRPTLQRVEARVVEVRRVELLRSADPAIDVDLSGLRGVHAHLFRDLYDWAGELRSVDTTKPGSVFARAVHLRTAAEEVFAAVSRDHLRRLDRRQSVDLITELLADINHLHPFREGNGRAQRTFLELFVRTADWHLDWTAVDPGENIDASRDAMRGDLSALRTIIDACLKPY